MSHPNLSVFSPSSFPQVLADREALDSARQELGIQDGDRLSTSQVREYLRRAHQIKLDHQVENQLPNCTHLDEGGYECGDPAIVQFLPDGDEGDCPKHLRLRELRAALAEVSRG